MLEKKIKTKVIKLDSFLKYIGIYASGSQSKEKILQGKIKVGNKVCFQRGKKLKNEDVVETEDGKKYKVKVIDT